MKHVFLLALAPLCLGGCSGQGAQYAPILDGPPKAHFQADLTACRTLARSQRQLDHTTAGAAVIGAGAGALLARAEGEGDAAGGALAGALAGGVAGAVDAGARREAIILACMRGRGHRVVG